MTISFPFDPKNAPFLKAGDNIVTRVSQGLIALTGYPAASFLGSPVLEVFNRLLCMHYESFEDRAYFVVTAKKQVKEVRIVELCGSGGEKTYLFYENPAFDPENSLSVFQILKNDSCIGIALYSARDYILLRANQRYLALFDAPYPKDCIGRALEELMPDFKGSESEKMWNEIKKTGNSYHLRSFPGAVGSLKGRFWDNTLTPIMEDGKVKFIISILEDVTERVVTEKHLKEKTEIIEKQKRQLEAIIDNISECLLITDKEGRQLMANAAARKISPCHGRIRHSEDTPGYSHLNEKGQVLLKEHLPLLRASRGERIRNQKLIIRRENRESFFNVNSTPVFDKNKNLIFAVTSCSDITELVEKEETIRKQNLQLEGIIENMSDALLIFDEDFKLFKINAAARAMFPNPNAIRSLEDMRDSFQITDLEGREIPIERSSIIRAFHGGAVKNERVVVRNSKGMAIIDVNAVKIDYGITKKVIICCHDVTELFQKQETIQAQQEKLMEAEKEKYQALRNAVEMKEEFLSLITHEFITPLAVIGSAVQAIEHLCRNDLSPKGKEFVAMIKQNSLRQLRLVNNLLEITRISTGHLKIRKKNREMVSLTKWITDSVLLIARQKEIRLSFSSSVRRLVIGIDEEKYERILLNLLSNAIKFTPRGRSVSVEVSRDSADKSMICVRVRDEGVGIPPDKQQLIFERFGQTDSLLTRQAEGTGIGLSLVKQYVESMGGKITVKSDIGQGSAFTLLLPAARSFEAPPGEQLWDTPENRLDQAVAVEFSDIYV